MRRLMPFVVLAGAAAAVTPVAAQTPAHATAARPAPAAGPTLGAVALAEALAANGDSISALAVLDDAIRSNPSDAAAWHRRGMLAWRTARVAWSGDLLSRQADSRRLALADSALRAALNIAPDSPRYLVDRGRFLLGSEYAMTRARATGLFRRALDVARQSGDSAAGADAADELGLLAWRDYEDLADRNILSETVSQPKDATLIDDPETLAFFQQTADRRAAAQRFSGELEYLEASEMFETARRLDPSNRRVLAHLYMALAERQNWSQLQGVAAERAATAPGDAWARLALGLAHHRLGESAQAAVAFDSALRLLPPGERLRLTRLSRILPPGDSASYAGLVPPRRAHTDSVYWMLADPLWLTPENEHQLEFLSRATFAELRWTAEDYGMRGADTDRGDIYVRYGPPPAVISFPPGSTDGGDSRTSLLWWYDVGSAFVFRQIPGYGVAPLSLGDTRRTRNLRGEVPVSWANVARERHVDSITVRVTRFRGAADSVDVFIAAELPTDSLASGTELARGALDVAFSAYTWRGDRLLHDSTRHVVDFAALGAREMRVWRSRIPQASLYFRVEALEPAARRGARGSGTLKTEADSGFGLSDVLVARAASPKPDVAPHRWTDFNLVPSVGIVRRGEPFSLVWENYRFAERGGSVRYRVQIGLARRAPNSVPLRNRILGAIGLGRGGTTVVLTYEKTAPAGPVVVEHVSVDPGAQVQAGTYALVVRVTDLHTGKTTVRESAITLLE
ncbi:MAG TPA: GWxTD domain-containing protein [Gemmatimonadaceae bacterium]|nr:GWxTD domain-containing protein [Gemmatimonadaceae bacterium]